MATWTFVKNITAQFAAGARQVYVDGTDLYMLDYPDGKVYKYVTTTDTLTEIYDITTELGANSGLEDIAFFSGELYLFTDRWDAGLTYRNYEIRKWTVTNTSTVEQLVLDSIANPVDETPRYDLLTDGSVLVATLLGSLGTPADNKVYYTTGAGWSAGAFSGTDPYTHGSYNLNSDPHTTYHPNGLYRVNCTNTGGGGGACASKAAYQWSGGAWVAVDTTPAAGELRQQAPDGAYVISSSYNDIYALSDFDTTINPATLPDDTDMFVVNMPFMVSWVYSVVTGTTLYKFNPATLDWEVWDADTTGGTMTSTTYIVRTSDNEVWAVGVDAGGGYYIWQRDEILPDPAGTNARFYFAPSGQALAQKFTLPFPGVAPNAMAIDRILGTVVIGSDRPAADPVIYSTYPYATGTVTDSGFPTGTSVQALRWV